MGCLDMRLTTMHHLQRRFFYGTGTLLFGHNDGVNVPGISGPSKNHGERERGSEEGCDLPDGRMVLNPICADILLTYGDRRLERK